MVASTPFSLPFPPQNRVLALELQGLVERWRAMDVEVRGTCGKAGKLGEDRTASGSWGPCASQHMVKRWRAMGVEVRESEAARSRWKRCGRVPLPGSWKGPFVGKGERARSGARPGLRPPPRIPLSAVTLPLTTKRLRRTLLAAFHPAPHSPPHSLPLPSVQTHVAGDGAAEPRPAGGVPEAAAGEHAAAQVGAAKGVRG